MQLFTWWICQTIDLYKRFKTVIKSLIKSNFEFQMVGFGSTEANKQSEVLRSSYLKVQNDSTCITFKPNVYKKLMNEFTFCAGYGPTSGKSFFLLYE